MLSAVDELEREEAIYRVGRPRGLGALYTNGRGILVEDCSGDVFLRYLCGSLGCFDKVR